MKLKGFNTRTYLSVGLSFLVASILLAGAFFGLVPDRAGALREGRTALSELAAASSTGAINPEGAPRVEAMLTFMLERNSDLRSAGVRRADGTLVVAAGDHATIIWPLLCGMAKAKYYLLLGDTLTGEEAERIGLVSMAVEDVDLDAKAVEVATRLVEGAQAAIRWTKYALNNWLRQAGPIFDASLALEFLGFVGPEAKEGIAAFLEKRPPAFPPDTPV